MHGTVLWVHKSTRGLVFLLLFFFFLAVVYLYFLCFVFFAKAQLRLLSFVFSPPALAKQILIFPFVTFALFPGQATKKTYVSYNNLRIWILLEKRRKKLKRKKKNRICPSSGFQKKGRERERGRDGEREREGAFLRTKGCEGSRRVPADPSTTCSTYALQDCG